MTYKSDHPNPIDDGLCTNRLTPAEKNWLRQIPEGDLSREIAYLKAMEIRLVTLLANLEDIPQRIRDDTEEPARVEYLRALAASALKISRLTRAMIDRSQAPNDPIHEPGSPDQNRPADVGQEQTSD